MLATAMYRVTSEINYINHFPVICYHLLFILCCFIFVIILFLFLQRFHLMVIIHIIRRKKTIVPGSSNVVNPKPFLNHYHGNLLHVSWWIYSPTMNHIKWIISCISGKGQRTWLHYEIGTRSIPLTVPFWRKSFDQRWILTIKQPYTSETKRVHRDICRCLIFIGALRKQPYCCSMH